MFSNKADPLCGKIIEHYFGAGRFVLVRGSRPGVPTKPDPTGLAGVRASAGENRSTSLGMPLPTISLNCSTVKVGQPFCAHTQLKDCII